MQEEYFNKGFDSGYYTCKMLYAKKWYDYQNDLISYEEWYQFCVDTFSGILEKNESCTN